jgi:nucleotide-binding universal stress UspA family protein
MSVAVAHHVSPTAEPALSYGARESILRKTQLDVIHVVEAMDLDTVEATRAGVSDAVEKVINGLGLPPIQWELHMVAGGTLVDDVTEAILTKVTELGPEVLVIGARRRSPVGKAFLGSVTQSLILEAEVPILVVKAPRPASKP